LKSHYYDISMYLFIFRKFKARYNSESALCVASLRAKCRDVMLQLESQCPLRVIIALPTEITCLHVIPRAQFSEINVDLTRSDVKYRKRLEISLNASITTTARLNTPSISIEPLLKPLLIFQFPLTQSSLLVNVSRALIPLCNRKVSAAQRTWLMILVASIDANEIGKRNAAYLAAVARMVR